MAVFALPHRLQKHKRKLSGDPSGRPTSGDVEDVSSYPVLIVTPHAAFVKCDHKRDDEVPRAAVHPPGFCSQIGLSGRDADSLLDPPGIGKALASQGITTEEPPPALLQVQPARPGSKDVMEAPTI
jgi:hypothetical protein